MSANKVILNDETLIDLSGDTVTENDVTSGVIFHGPDGEQRIGKAPKAVFKDKSIVFFGNRVADVVGKFASKTGATCYDFTFDNLRASMYSFGSQFNASAIVEAIVSGDYADIYSKVSYVSDELKADFQARLEVMETLDWSSVDYIICTLGRDDWGYSNKNSYKTSMSAGIIEKILTKYPNISFVKATPIYGFTTQTKNNDFLYNSTLMSLFNNCNGATKHFPAGNYVINEFGAAFSSTDIYFTAAGTSTLLKGSFTSKGQTFSTINIYSTGDGSTYMLMYDNIVVKHTTSGSLSGSEWIDETYKNLYIEEITEVGFENGLSFEGHFVFSDEDVDAVYTLFSSASEVYNSGDYVGAVFPNLWEAVPTSDTIFVDNVRFTSNEKTFSSIKIVTRVYSNPKGLDVYYDNILVFDGARDSWVDEAYRTITVPNEYDVIYAGDEVGLGDGLGESCSLTTYVEADKELSSELGIQVIDCYSIGINKYTKGHFYADPEYTKLSDAGNELVATYLATHL